MRILDPISGAKVLCMALTVDHCSFMMYHQNSYANNPVMLRSPKPMIMRDIFLTKCNATFPNPLSCIYSLDPLSAATDVVSTWLIGLPVASRIGWPHCLGVYVVGGMFSGFAYLFQSQLSKTKNNTKFDCNCTSRGALAAFFSLSFLVPQCYVPMTNRFPAAILAAGFISLLAYDEYIRPKVFPPQPGSIELTNWGFVGGVFGAMIYSSLFLRTKTDFGMMRRFYGNITTKS